MKRLRKIKIAVSGVSVWMVLLAVLLFGKWHDMSESYMLLLFENQGENVDASLVFKIGGEVKKIHSFQGADKYYFFVPSGVSGKDVRIMNRTRRKMYQGTKEIKELDIMIACNSNELAITYLGKNEQKEIMNFCFIQETQVATLFVDIDKEIEHLEENKEEVAKGKILAYDAENKTTQTAMIQFKGHGNGAFFKCDKKSWRIKVDDVVSLLGLAAGKEYVAISNALDDSYLRNQIVYDIAENAGFTYTPEGKFVNLYVNGNYQGLYFLSEKVEVSAERVNIINESLNAEKTGYLFKEDSGDEKENELDESEFIASDGAMFKIIFPETPTQKQIDDLKTTIENLQEGIEQDDGICETVYGRKEHYSEIIDMDSFVKKYLIEEISKNRDGNERSSYYYVHWMGEDIKLYAGPIWDYDMALGNWWGDITWNNPQGIVRYRLGFDRREDFMQIVRTYYKDYFHPYLEDKAEIKIREYAQLIENSVKMDTLRWNKNSLEKESFTNSVEKLIWFVKARKAFLDDVWIYGKTYHRVNYVDEDKIIKNIYVEDGKILENYIPEQQDKNFLGWYDEDLEEEWDFEQPVTDNMALWAKWEDE